MKLRTEFGGDDEVPANVQPKPSSALTASEQLRLTYLTGQPKNPLAPRDGGLAWTGQVAKKVLRRTRPAGWPFSAPASYDIESLLIPGPPGPPGPQGLQGPAGTGGPQYLTKTAALAISGHRLVTARADGQVENADNGRSDHLGKPIWLTLHAVEAGELVQVLLEGEATEPTWSWLLQLPIYLGVDGGLTQSVPVSAEFMLEVARPITSTTILFDPQIPIALGA